MAWCVNYLKDNITLINISQLVQSLIPKQNECPCDLRDKVLDWIIDNYFDIYQEQNQNLRLCEEFLAKNIERGTIVKISQFISRAGGRNSFIKSYRNCVKSKPDQAKRGAEGVWEQETMQLRGRVCSFLQENWKEIKQGPIGKDLPQGFLIEILSILFETPNLNEKKSVQQCNFEESGEEKEVKNGKLRSLKRNEPLQKDSEADGNPELKKTKK